MKKFLSMVLALVMSTSLITVSAGAKDFTDTDSIDYLEAVEVMAGVGVVDGYTDGSFGPHDNLTRAQAAKIICNLILGPTTAGALAADAAPFSDVPASQHFAGYIAYCRKEGIISGRGNGTYGPNDTLTGYEFMKMLLGALGYKAEQEGYVGSNWSINVAKQAIALGLEDGLKDEFNGSDAVTRQEALLYAFNTLQATMVKYDNDSTISVGDVTITTKSEAKEVPGNGTDYGMGDGNMQFCEKYFSKLKAEKAEDVYGRPATRWTWKSDEIGVYNKAPRLTYNTNVLLHTVRKDLGLSSSEQPYFYAAVQYQYDNGGEGEHYQVNGDGNNEYYYDIEGGSSGTRYVFETTTPVQLLNTYKSTDTAASTKLAALAGTYGGNYPAGRGVTVEIYYDAEASRAGDYTGNKVVYIDEMLGEVNAVKSDDEGRYVTLKGVPGKFYTDDFKKGDRVLYTVGVNAGEKNIASMELAETLTGTVTWITDDGAAGTRSDGFWRYADVNGDGVKEEGEREWAYYHYPEGFQFNIGIDGVGKYNHGDNWFNHFDLDLGDQVIAYLDSAGHIVHVEVTSAVTALDKLVLLDANSDTANLAGIYEGAVIYGDGTKEVVSLFSEYEEAVGAVYNYTTSGGKLKLVQPAGYSTVKASIDGTEAFKKGDVTIDGIKVDNSTGFVFINEKGEIKTYVGFKNAPSIKAGGIINVTALTKDSTGVAAVAYVWVKNDSTYTTSSDYLYMIRDTYSQHSTANAAGEKISYFEVRTLDGTTVKVDASVYNAHIKAATYGAVAVDSVTYLDDTDIIGSVTLVSDTLLHSADDTADGVAVETRHGVLYAGAEALAYADDAAVYVVANNGDSFYQDDIESLDNTYQSYIAIENDKGLIETLILKEMKA